MFRLIATLLAGLALLFLCLRAQGQRYSFQYYGESYGLTNLDSHCLYQDKQGLLWVCTESGVFRFDGAEFRLIPLPTIPETPYITGLAQDLAGRMWISTESELFLQDSAGIRKIAAPHEGFQFNLYSTLIPDPEDGNALYFLTGHQLTVVRRRADDTWSAMPVLSPSLLKKAEILSQISTVYAAGHHDFWLGCGGEICHLQGGVVRRYGKESGLPAEQWRRIFLDRQNRVWIRSERHIFYLDPVAKKFIPCSKGLAGSLLEVRDPTIIEDPQGRILVNLTQGLARLQDDGWQIFHPRTELPPYSLSDLLVDRQGSLWMGLSGHGLARWLGYDEWEGWNTANGLSSETVWNFLRDRYNTLWVATESNLERLSANGQDLQIQLDGKGNPMRRVQTLAQSANDHLWIGSDNGGVFDFDPQTKKSILVTNQTGIFKILIDRSGRVWICSLNGLFLADANNPAQGAKMVSLPEAPQGDVYEAVEDHNGSLWFIADSGLHRWAKNQWKQIALPASYHPSVSAQLALAPDSTLWVSGADPLLLHLRVSGETATEVGRVDLHTLHSNTVYFIGFDRRGWMWIGTGRGLDVFDGARHKHLSMDDGLIWNEFDSDGFYEDRDGTLWLGTSGGISHLLHPERVFRTEPLRLALAEAKLGDTPLVQEGFTKIPWGVHRSLTVHCASLDFAREHAVSYRYRLEGIDEEWQTSAKHDIRYPSIPAGEYKLTVMAVDDLDDRYSEPVSFRLEILPPWWKSRRMFAAYAVLSGLLLLLIWRWSVRFLVAQKNRLELLVRQRTQELEREKTELLKARAALEEQATHDPLTGLLNRTALFEQLAQEIARANREHTSLAVILTDLDHFKRVNDTYGHITGDHVLKEYANRLQSVVRPYDFVGRYGGEELLLIMPGLPLEDGRKRVEEMHKRAFESTFDCNGYRLAITCSFGLAWFEPGQDTIESLIESADYALYTAKRNGRNRVEVFHAMADPAHGI